MFSSVYFEIIFLGPSNPFLYFVLNQPKYNKEEQHVIMENCILLYHIL